MGVVVISSFILNSLANLNSGLDSLRPFYLTEYFQGINALTAEVSVFYTAGLLGVLLMSFVVTVWIFLRRDIAVKKPLKSLISFGVSSANKIP